MIEKIRCNVFSWQMIQKDDNALHHRVMKALVIGVGIIIPILFGNWRYQTTSEPSPLADGIWIGFLSAFFSLGLWLSVTKKGKRFKSVTLPLIILGSPVHLLFFSYPILFLLIVILAEIYAVYSLFRRTTN